MTVPKIRTGFADVAQEIYERNRGIVAPEQEAIALRENVLEGRVAELTSAVERLTNFEGTGYTRSRALMLEAAVTASMVVGGVLLLAGGIILQDLLVGVGGFILLGVSLAHASKK